MKTTNANNLCVSVHIGVFFLFSFVPAVKVVASLSWRVKMGVAAALRRAPWEASRCSDEETFDKLCRAYYPHYTIGVDRQGRPVLVQKVRFDLLLFKKYFSNV